MLFELRPDKTVWLVESGVPKVPSQATAYATHASIIEALLARLQPFKGLYATTRRIEHVPATDGSQVGVLKLYWDYES